MADVNELTPQQEQMMVEIRDTWIGHLCNLKLDKEKAANSVDWLYSLIELPAPKKIFVKSPLAAQYASNMLAALNDKGLVPDNLF